MCMLGWEWGYFLTTCISDFPEFLMDPACFVDTTPEALKSFISVLMGSIFYGKHLQDSSFH